MRNKKTHLNHKEMTKVPYYTSKKIEGSKILKTYTIEDSEQ